MTMTMPSSPMNETLLITRSQAVASIADRTASQHIQGSRDVIGLFNQSDQQLWFGYRDVYGVVTKVIRVKVI